MLGIREPEFSVRKYFKKAACSELVVSLSKKSRVWLI